jgi:hypothetical protein
MSTKPLAQGDSKLMTQHQDLGVLPPRLPPGQAQHRHRTGDNEEDQLQAHKPKIIARPPRANRPLAATRALALRPPRRISPGGIHCRHPQQQPHRGRTYFYGLWRRGVRRPGRDLTITPAQRSRPRLSTGSRVDDTLMDGKSADRHGRRRWPSTTISLGSPWRCAASRRGTTPIFRRFLVRGHLAARRRLPDRQLPTAGIGASSEFFGICAATASRPGRSAGA